VTRAPARSSKNSPVLVDPGQIGLFSETGASQIRNAQLGLQRYQVLTWAYSAITRVASDIAGLPFKILSGPERDAKEVEGGELRKLLENPNDLMSFAELIEALLIYLEAAGRAPIFLETFRGSQVRELWPLKPQKLQVVLEPQKIIGGWIYRTGAGDQQFPPEAIVQVAYFDPFMPYGGGQPQLMAADVAAASSLSAWKWNRKWFDQGASPSVLVTMPRGVDPDYREQFKRELRTDWSGPDAVAAALLLDDFEGDVQLVSPSHREMGFPQLIEMGREDVLAVLGVPPAMAGLFKGLNLAQVEMQERIYWTSKNVPLTHKLESYINRGIAPRVQEGAFFRFDTSGVKVLQEDEGALLERRKTKFRHGVLTLNEWLEEEGLPQIGEEGKRRYIETSLAEIPTPEEREEKAARADALAAQLAKGKKPGEEGDEKAPEASSSGQGPPDGEEEEGDRRAGNVTLRDAAPPPPSREETRAAAWAGFDGMLREGEDILEAVWNAILGELADHVVRQVRKRPPVPPADEGKAAKPAASRLLDEWVKNGPLTPGQEVALDRAAPLLRYTDHLGVVRAIPDWPTGTSIPLPDDAISYLPEVGELTREVTERHGIIFRRLLSRFGFRALEQVSKELVFDEGAPEALSLLRRDADRVGEEVVRLLDDVTETLEAGMREGESLGGLVDRIRSTVGASPNTPARGGPTVRSQRIARTETLAAANSGTVEGYRQGDVEMMEWLTSRDAHVRDSHAEMEGDITFVGQPFSNGLLFPGDPAGPAEEIINCRCTTLPVIQPLPGS
jgi:HK97 family phage portal protein